MYEHIWKPGKIGKLELQNRLVMPGMGTNVMGRITDHDAAWYAARAKGGYGLIITEFMAIQPNGKAIAGEVVAADDSIIPDLRKLTDAVHQYGTKIFMQIHHAGRQTSSTVIRDTPVSPSPIPCPVNQSLPREMTTEEVYEMIEAYGDAAVRAKKGGYDGVEIHGAHGYLPAQFMSHLVNRRIDEFGGDLKGRTRFGELVVKNIKKKCGEDFPVIMRISGDELVDGGRPLKETIMQIKLLEKAGLDAIDVSIGLYSQVYMLIASSQIPNGYNIEAAREVKKHVHIPVIGMGRLNDPLYIDSLLEDDYADFVITGRAAIADPEFPNKIKEDRTDEISPCIACMARCTSRAGSDKTDDIWTSCACNPFSGHDNLQIKQTDTPKNVVVVGAGPGGLEAAWVAAACGHKVTLLEKNYKVGGQVNFACVPPSKFEMARAIKYFKTMCDKHGVDIQLNTEATAESILALKPDAVILATGATPIMLNVENAGIPVAQANDILGAKVIAEDRLLVIGGGMVGIETAEYLLSQNRTCDIVEMLDDIGLGESEFIIPVAKEKLRKGGVKAYTNCKLLRFTEDGAVCEHKGEEITLSGYDMAVMAIGSRPNNSLAAELEGKVPQLFTIGDAVEVGKLATAVDAGARAALKI